MSVGNLLAGLLMGMLPSALGMKRSVLLLTIGYAVGYAGLPDRRSGAAGIAFLW